MCTGEVSQSTQSAKNNTIHNLNVQHIYILYIKVIYHIIQLNTCINDHAMLILVNRELSYTTVLQNIPDIMDFNFQPKNVALVVSLILIK